MVGLIIGRFGETLKLIQESTECEILIPNFEEKLQDPEDLREIKLRGKKDNREKCKTQILSMIHIALYGRELYMGNQFYPFMDPVTHLPIIDPEIMSKLDPNNNDIDNKPPTTTHPTNTKKPYFSLSRLPQELLQYDLIHYNNPVK